jgi:hypothetical protein
MPFRAESSMTGDAQGGNEIARYSRTLQIDDMGLDILVQNA